MVWTKSSVGVQFWAILGVAVFRSAGDAIIFPDDMILKAFNFPKDAPGNGIKHPREDSHLVIPGFPERIPTNVIKFPTDYRPLASHSVSGIYFYGKDNGPETWPFTYSDECSGSQQSPINIEDDQVIPEIHDPFVIYSFDRKPLYVNVTNSGNRADLTYAFESQSSPLITNGGLPGVFKFIDIHFHWGEESSVGSEHTINGRSYPMEMHLVTMNIKYNNLTEALDRPDGIAVLAFIYRVSNIPRTGRGFNLMMSSIKNINLPEQTVQTLDNAFPIQDMFFDLTSTLEFGYYRYIGSLTTPLCNENVIWTVFKEIQDVAEEQLELMRGMFGFQDEPMKNNFRPPQPLNGRIVHETGHLNLKNSIINSFVHEVEHLLLKVPLDVLETSPLLDELLIRIHEMI